jgi:hypothetical protein
MSILFEAALDEYKISESPPDASPTKSILSADPQSGFRGDMCMADVELDTDRGSALPVETVTEFERFLAAHTTYLGEVNCPLQWWKVCV